MTLPAPSHHPLYRDPGNPRVHVLLGDAVHDTSTGITGHVWAIFPESVDVHWDDNGQISLSRVTYEDLRYGPAPTPEPPELTIRPTWDNLRYLVATVIGRDDVGRLVYDAIPPDVLAKIRADIGAVPTEVRTDG